MIGRRPMTGWAMALSVLVGCASADVPESPAPGRCRVLTPIVEPLESYSRVEIVEFANPLGAAVPAEVRQGLETAVAEELSGLKGIKGVQVMIGPSATAVSVLRVEGRIISYLEADNDRHLGLRVELRQAGGGKRLGEAIVQGQGRTPAAARSSVARALAGWIEQHRGRSPETPDTGPSR